MKHSGFPCFPLAALIASLLVACGPSAEMSATKTAARWTPTTIATSAPTDTPTPEPSFTPLPSSTPTPTITLTPSITPTLSEHTLSVGPGEPIIIGYMLAETLELGADSKRGIEVALADAGNDLFGHPLELAGFDTECNSLAAGRAARYLLVKETLVGVIGTSCSRAAPSALKELSVAGTVMISPSNTDPDLTATDSHDPGYLRTAPNDIVQAQTVADFASAELKATRMATIFYASDRYSLHMKDAACREFVQTGGECVAERQINHGDTYLTAVLNRIGQTRPDVLYLILGPQEASLIIKQFRETPGLENTPVVIEELSFGPGLLSLAGEDSVGVYLTRTSLDFNRSSDAYQTFLLGYRDLFAAEPATAFHAFAYDATNLLLQAIGRAAIQQADGSLLIDREAVQAQLYATDGFAGLTGSLTCSLSGDCADPTLGGIIYLIESDDPTTWNPGVGLAANPIQVWPKP